MDIGSILSSSAHGANQMPQAPSKTDITDMVERLIEAKDQDGTGTLGADELCISEEAFRRLDANQDSQLDSEELIDGLEQIRQKMGQLPVMGMMKGLKSEDDEDEEQTLLDLLASNEDEDETTSTGLDLIA